jgi:thiol-disulfide isomerase/thioredoxin
MNSMWRYGILCILFSLFNHDWVEAQVSQPLAIVYLNEPNVSFDDLINKFKGKIIYLDVWATWCAPCRKELQKKNDIKSFAEFAQSNNVIVLYICCDKGGNSWKQFAKINQLSGYHLLASQSINKTFHTRFSVPKGIHGKRHQQKAFFLPRHMVIDQSGAICDSAAERQGMASVYHQINQLMKN